MSNIDAEMLRRMEVAEEDIRQLKALDRRSAVGAMVYNNAGASVPNGNAHLNFNTVKYESHPGKLWVPATSLLALFMPISGIYLAGCCMEFTAPNTERMSLRMTGDTFFNARDGETTYCTSGQVNRMSASSIFTANEVDPYPLPYITYCQCQTQNGMSAFTTDAATASVLTPCVFFIVRVG